ncbi:MAG TPA: ABC transporter ATP-binding protein [Balneolaceae bacterium]|nr:ABC transporter ATP-binding protein [Balneolaceae bacterium]
MKSEAIISTQNLEIGFPPGAGRSSPKTVASQINVALNRGEVVCLLGPNGSGKSTLIRTLSGLHTPLDGRIQLSGRELSAFSAKEKARKISTVLTDRIIVGNLSVYELVSFGRTPYTGWFGSLRKKDEKIIHSAIESTGLEPFVDRDVLRLSDGERQKVMIARALAQDTPVILLDEPTAHLDLPNRVEIIRLLRRLSHQTQKGILLSTHELDLALRAADTLWLMSSDGKVITGTPEDLVLEGSFESVFARDSFDFDRSSGSFTLHQPTKQTAYLSGDAVAKFWTRRALEREGFKVNETKRRTRDARASVLQIEVKNNKSGFVWKVSTGKGGFSSSSIKELVARLRIM